MGALGPWLWVGLAWWVAALAAAVPYRHRHRTIIRWLRPTVGLPLTVAAWLEVARSRRRRMGWERRAPYPYRGLAPLALSLVVAEVFAVVAGLLVRLVSG